MEVRQILGHATFLTWGCERSAQPLGTDVLFLNIRADFPNTKQKPVFSGAKQILKTTSVLHICCFPCVRSDGLFSGSSLGETNSLLTRETSAWIILNLGLALRIFLYRQ